MQANIQRLRQRREALEGQGGFTLIELLIVIVILGILAAIVVFAVQNLTSSSASSACQSDAQTVDHAVQAFYAQVGSYPNEVAELESNTVHLSDGRTGGPWLHNTPTNGTQYAIELDPAVTGSAASWKVATVTAVPPTTQSSIPAIDVLGKWDAGNSVWTTKTAYNPPTNTPAAACTGISN